MKYERTEGGICMLILGIEELSAVCFVLRLEDATLANTKLQQSLKIKEEKITELETQ